MPVAMRSCSSSSVTAVMVGHIEAPRLGDRQPDKFDELGIGPDETIGAMGNCCHIRGKKAAVETPWPSGRRNGSCNKMDGAEIGDDSGLRKGLPGTSRRNDVACARAEHQAGFLVGFADGGERIAGSFDFARPLHAQHQAFGVSSVQRRRGRHQPVGWAQRVRRERRICRGGTCDFRGGVRAAPSARFRRDRSE